MDGIKKFSKEWFASQKLTDAQKASIESLKTGSSKPAYRGADISTSLFLGTKDAVNENYQNLIKSTTGMPSSTLVNVQNYGLDNIFSVLDADCDGTVTEQEVQDIAALSTPQFADEEDTKFTTEDLEILYDNAMAAVDASFVDNGNVKDISYADGSKTTITLNDKGEIVEQKDVSTNALGQTVEKIQNFEEKYEINSRYDAQNRLVYKDEDYEGVVNDKTTKIQYGNILSGQPPKVTGGSTSGSSTTKPTATINGTNYYISSQGSTAGAIKTEETIGTKTVSVVDNKGYNIDSELSVKYDSDKQIGYTNQKDIGDCWLLAGVNALSYSTKGQEIIKQSIQHNDDGSVTVNLAGVGKSYTYSADEVAAHEYTDKSLSYSTGDIDMNILEMAISEYRKENFDNNESSFFGLDRAHNKGCATSTDPASGGILDEAVYLLTGTDSKYYINPRIVDVGKYADSMLNDFQANPDDYAMVCTFKEENSALGDVVTDHVYSIKSVDDDNVYVVNPWDSSEVITYPREDFIDNLDDLSSTDLVEATTAKKLDSQKWDNKLVSAISENILGPADTLLRPTVEDAIEKGKEYVDDVKELVTEIKNGDIDWGAVADEAVDDVKDWFKSKFSW